MPPESIQSERVALEPVQKLMGGETEMPLRGTDPRNTERQKIFSAHPVMHNDVLQGYLYAILGGQKYDELADSVRGSYVQKLSLGALVAIVLAAFLVGLLVFGLLTRRLTGLTAMCSASPTPDSIRKWSRPWPQTAHSPANRTKSASYARHFRAWPTRSGNNLKA